MSDTQTTYVETKQAKNSDADYVLKRVSDDRSSPTRMFLIRDDEEAISVIRGLVEKLDGVE